MLFEICNEVEIGRYAALDCYDPQNLKETALGLDKLLDQYLQEYQKAGLQVVQYQSIDDFVLPYLNWNSSDCSGPPQKESIFLHNLYDRPEESALAL